MVGEGVNASASTAFQQGLASVSVLGADAVTTTIFVIGGTGMAVGIVAFFLDNTTPTPARSAG
jgi:hypothetical protein